MSNTLIKGPGSGNGEGPMCLMVVTGIREFAYRFSMVSLQDNPEYTDYKRSLSVERALAFTSFK